MYQYGLGISQDYVQAVYLYQRAANQDNTDAQTNLGYMYEYGLGVSKDAIKAVQLYRKAAKQGNTCAQFYFGCMYMLGRGVFKDNAQAAHWFRKAATQDHKFSQRCLGWLYMTGYGVIQDDAQAVQWYRKAAEQGEVGAQNNLGWMYLMGRGVLQDDVQAVYWYRKAAEQGDATAQYNLGWMYDNGRGISKDGVQAEQWYLQAAEQGMPSTQLAGKSFKWDPVVKAESILVASGASFSHDQSTEPLYRLMKDSIHLPPRENFEDPAAYYGTCLHELAHWAMHPSRLNLKRGIFPSKAFARAEICAELASWMIGQDAGIPHDPGRHAAYIQIWCKALRVDLYEIQPICRDAKQIKKYLLNLEHTKRIELNTIGTMPKREEDIAAVGILTDSTPENHFGIVLCRKKESLKNSV